MLSFLSVRRKGRGTPKSISKITKLFVPNKNLLQCKVVFLDGTDISLDLSKKAAGGDLYKWVFYSLDLIEKDYFGLQYTDADNVDHWLDSNKAVKKQVKVGPPYTFHLKVKFYSSEPSMLQEELTRYQFFLQLKHDIAEGKLPCSPEKAVELSALALQSELGDFDEKRHTPALISEFRFIPDQTEEFELAVLEAYQSCRGLTPAQAEINYLSKVIWLPNYAVKNYVVLGNDSNEYLLGLMPTGVKLVEGSEQIGLFRWPNILRLDFKKEKITLVAVDDNGHEEHTFVFRLHDKKTCKRLWKSAVEYHTFFRLHAPGKAPTVRQNLLRLGSRFWYRGKTESPLSQQCEPRRSAQFERRPSQRYARRQSHVLRLAQEENADTLPSKMNLRRCRGDDDSFVAPKPEATEATTVCEVGCMTTIEETADIEATSSLGTEDVEVLPLCASEEISATKGLTDEAVVTEEVTCERARGEDIVGSMEMGTTEMEALTAAENEATVATSEGTPCSPASLTPTTFPIASALSPSVAPCPTPEAAPLTVNPSCFPNAAKRLELQPILVQDAGLSTPPSTPTFTVLSVNNSFQSFSVSSDLPRANAPEPSTSTFSTFLVNSSFQSASKSLELLRVENPKVSSTLSTPTFASFIVNSNFQSASKSSALQRVESSEPSTPTLAPLCITNIFQSASKSSELEQVQVSTPPSTPTFAPLSVCNSFKSASKPVELERVETSQVSTPPCTQPFSPFSVNNIFQNASKVSELTPMQRVSTPPTTPTLLTPTPVIEVSTAKLVSTAE